jgi:hypothetical protein
MCFVFWKTIQILGHSPATVEIYTVQDLDIKTLVNPELQYTLTDHLKSMWASKFGYFFAKLGKVPCDFVCECSLCIFKDI